MMLLILSQGKKHETMSRHVDYQLLREPVCKNWFEKNPRDPVDLPMNLPVNNSENNSNLKDNQCLKFISKQQNIATVFPVHGILKNPTRTASAKSTGVTGEARDGNVLKACHELVKHVTFLGKDDIVGEENKECPSWELPPLQTRCQLPTDVFPSSDNSDSRKGEKFSCPTERKVVNENVKDVVSNITVRTVRFSERKNLSDSCNLSDTPVGHRNRNCTDIEDICLDETVDLNSETQIYSHLNGTDSYSGKQQVLIPTNEEVSNSDGRIGAEESILRTSVAQSSTVPTESGVSESDVQATTKDISSQPSTSCSMTNSKENERQSDISVEGNISFIRDIPESQQKCLFVPKDIVSSICFSTGSRTSGESKLAVDLLPTCRDKSVYENFIGLPLNSQGELIKSHLSGNFGISALFTKQKKGGCSLHNFASPTSSKTKCKNHLGKVKMKYSGSPLYQKDLKWSNEQYCLPNRQVTSGLCYTEVQNVETREVPGHEWAKAQNQYVNYYPISELSGNRFRGFNQTHNRSEMEMFQPEGSLDQRIHHSTRQTMRLMGKNVTISESSKEYQGSTDRNIWTDKEIIAERLSTNPHSNQWPQQHQAACSALGISERNLLQPVNAPPSLYFPGMQSRSTLSPFDYKQKLSSSGMSSTSGDLGSIGQNFSQPLHPEAMLNKTHMPISNCISTIESAQMGCHKSPGASYTQNNCQLMPLNSIHCKHSQSLCYDTSSTFPAAFPNHNHGNIVWPFSVSSPCYTLQWPVNAGVPKNQNSSPYSDPFSGQHPYARPGTKLPFPSPYPTSIFPFSICNTNGLASSNPVSLAQSSCIQSSQTSTSTSTIGGAYGNMIENSNGINKKFTYLGGANDTNLSRKRSADRSDGSMRPGKKPSLTACWDFSAPIEPRRTKPVHGYIPCNTEPPNLLGHGHKRMTMNFQKVDNERNGNIVFRTSSMSGFVKHDNGLRPEVVRLRAGAKHILRLCQDMGTDNVKPVHSIIPFGVGTSSGKTQISLKKTTKVYSF